MDGLKLDSRRIRRKALKKKQSHDSDSQRRRLRVPRLDNQRLKASVLGKLLGPRPSSASSRSGVCFPEIISER